MRARRAAPNQWALSSGYKLDKASIASAMTALLESVDVEFEHPPTVEEALYVWAHHPGADFADCLLTARAPARALSTTVNHLRRITSW